MYLALCGGPHIFTLRFTCAVLLWNSLEPVRISVTGISPSLSHLSKCFSYSFWSHVGLLTPDNSGLGSTDFARHYSRYRFLFLFLRLLRCFTSAGIANFFLFDSEKDNDALPSLGYPIRKSPDHRVFATPRSLSQLITSFIAIQHQGIHCVPFKA